MDGQDLIEDLIFLIKSSKCWKCQKNNIPEKNTLSFGHCLLTFLTCRQSFQVMKTLDWEITIRQL